MRAIRFIVRIFHPRFGERGCPQQVARRAVDAAGGDTL